MGDVRWAGHKVNQPGTDPWLIAIGKLIVNFATLEFQTYYWLTQLTQTFPLPSADGRAFFRTRVERILSMAGSRAECAPWGGQIRSAWQKALDLAEFRNSIAHSPLIFLWEKGDESRGPKEVAIVDVRSAVRSDQVAEVTIKLADLHVKLDAIPPVAEELLGLHRSIWPGSDGAASSSAV